MPSCSRVLHVKGIPEKSASMPQGSPAMQYVMSSIISTYPQDKYLSSFTLEAPIMCPKKKKMGALTRFAMKVPLESVHFFLFPRVIFLMEAASISYLGWLPPPHGFPAPTLPRPCTTPFPTQLAVWAFHTVTVISSWWSSPAAGMSLQWFSLYPESGHRTLLHGLSHLSSCSFFFPCHWASITDFIQL